MLWRKLGGASFNDLGSYDLGKIHGAITLRKAENGEGYSGIGKDFLDMENMLVLADDEGISVLPCPIPQEQWFRKKLMIFLL